MITVGLTVLNGEAYLLQAIGSLLDNDIDFEFVILNNGSTDRTREICLSFSDKRIKYYFTEPSLSREDTFRFLLSNATGEHFMLGSDDDVWSYNYLSSLEMSLKENTNCVIAYPRVIAIDEAGKAIRGYPKIEKLSLVDNLVDRLIRFLIFQEREGKANILMGLIKTDVLRKASLHKNTIWGSDYLMLFEMAFSGMFVYNKDATLYKRQTKKDRLRYAGKDVKLLKEEYLSCYEKIITSKLSDKDTIGTLLRSLELKRHSGF